MKVIIPVWIINNELLELTKNTIFSFNNHDLIIVDNASELGGGYLRSLAHTYILNKTNLGFAKAVNQGLRIVQDEYVAIANNDIRVTPNWADVAKIVLAKKNTYSCHFKMCAYDEPIILGKDMIYSGMERWCQGSFFVLRRLEKVYYDEGYLNSYDDWDFFHTIRSKGYKTAYTNKAAFQHHDSYSQKLIPEREKNNEYNRKYFQVKWGETPEELFWRLYPDQMLKHWRTGFI